MAETTCPHKRENPDAKKHMAPGESRLQPEVTFYILITVNKYSNLQFEKNSFYVYTNFTRIQSFCSLVHVQRRLRGAYSVLSHKRKPYISIITVFTSLLLDVHSTINKQSTVDESWPLSLLVRFFHHTAQLTLPFIVHWTQIFRYKHTCPF